MSVIEGVLSPVAQKEVNATAKYNNTILVISLMIKDRCTKGIMRYFQPSKSVHSTLL